MADIDVDNMSEEEFDRLVSEDSPAPEAEVEAEAPEAEVEAEAPEAEVEAEAPEAEVVAEGEEEDEPEPEPEPEAKRPVMLPKRRYDAAKARAEAAEQRAAELEQQLAQRQQSQPQEQQLTYEQQLDAQLADIDRQVAEAMADNDTAKVAQLMNQGRQMERQFFQQQAYESSQNTTAVTREQIEYDTYLGQVESSVPELNPDSESYDEDLTLEVADLMNAFTGRGMNRADALERALGYALPGDEPAPEPAAAEPVVRKTNVTKNVETARKQPPSMDEGRNSDAGGKSGSIDIFKMTDAELDKLTEAEWDKLAEA